MTQRVTAQTHTLAEQGDSGVWRNGTSVDTPSGSVVFPTLGAIFSDDFGSGDMSATSVESGFAWSSLNRTSIVTQDADCSTPGNDVVIWNGAAICTDIGASGRDWSALTGKNSLRFRYPADEEMAEQRFTMDSQTELWVSFWTRVPLNFTQGSLNSKFCVIWADNYSGPVFAQWQTRPTDPATGGALIGVTDGPSSINSGEEQKTAFITVPDDRGRWMQCVHRLK
ncbi:MAG: hypothetical protein GY774_04985, partial [Planctomycetes bacterium]|nr:hypothetical protein [Planctomycetota bacterium]